MAKQPYKPLTDLDIMADPPAAGIPPLPVAAPLALPPSSAAEEEKAAAPPPEARRQMNYRATISTAEKLRLLSFRQRRPIQELIDEAVLMWLSNQK